MKSHLVAAISLAPAVLFASTVASATPPPASSTLAAAINACATQGCTVTGYQSVATSLPDVVHESFVLEYASMPAPYNKIGMHRIHRTSVPTLWGGRSANVMMIHGDLFNFSSAFLDSDPTYISLPLELADRGIDVWGTDRRETFPPSSEVDEKEASWGIPEEVADATRALKLARAVRSQLQIGGHPMNVLGWSRGGQIGYALLSDETTKPAQDRDVSGFIPVDIYLKTDDTQLKTFACNRLQGAIAQQQANTYFDATGAFLSAVATQVTIGNGNNLCTFPACAALGLSSLTYAQITAIAGTSTYLFFNGNPVTPHYHFTAPDTSGAQPLLYTPFASWVAMTAAATPSAPIQVALDGDAAICNDPLYDVAFDDHLDDIEVPAFYVGADGGFGSSGLYTLNLLASTDLYSEIIDLNANDLQDFGHVDLFHARFGHEDTWDHIGTWLEGHVAFP